MEIKIENVTKRFGKKKLVFDNLNFIINSGEITGLVGDNSTGKTTLLDLISDRLITTSGVIKVDDEVIFENSTKLRNISINKQDAAILNTTKKLINLSKIHYKDFNEEYFLSLCDKFNLKDKLNVRFKSLSTGEQCIFLSILVLSTNTKIMLLDEPLIGLDSFHRELLCQSILEKYNELENTIIISSHLLEELSTVVQNICLLNNKKVSFIGSVHDFTEPYNTSNLNDVVAKRIQEAL